MPTILLVDDEPLLRRAFRTLLEASGYDVSEAGSAREAIERVRTDRPSLILLDLGLPDRPGLEVVRELAAAPGTHAPVIAMTGRSGPDISHECLEAGCSGHLVKPIEPRELVRRIPAWLGQPPKAARAENRV
jgi:two-component system KDP operon response regulator KdpE